MTLQSYLDSLNPIHCSFGNVTDDFTMSNVFRTFKQFTSIEFINNVIPAMEYNPMLWSLLGSVVVGLSGVVPLLVIPIEEGANLNKGGMLTNSLSYGMLLFLEIFVFSLVRMGFAIAAESPLNGSLLMHNVVLHYKL